MCFCYVELHIVHIYVHTYRTFICQKKQTVGSTVGPIRFSSRDKGFWIVKIKVGVAKIVFFT